MSWRGGGGRHRVWRDGRGLFFWAAEGLENKTIAAELGAAPDTVGVWRRRFAERRLEGLHDEPRPGTPRRISDDAVAETIRRTLEETPADATHWSLRSMARSTGYAPSTIHRIWRAFGLQPHRSKSFKLSSDPFFVEKVRDIVGLYLNPPERALVENGGDKLVHGSGGISQLRAD